MAKRKLTVKLERSVASVSKKPENIEISLVAVAGGDSLIDSSLARLSDSRKIRLVEPITVVEFDVTPSDEATPPILYRIGWRRGVTGRLTTRDFFMPDENIDLDDIDKGGSIPNESFVPKSDIGKIGGIAKLNINGDVVTADNKPVATREELTRETTEIRNQIANSDDQMIQNFNSSLSSTAAELRESFTRQVENAQTFALENTTTKVNEVRDELTAADDRISEDVSNKHRELSALISSNTDRNTSAENRLNNLELQLPVKADLVSGKVPQTQLPDSAYTRVYRVSTPFELVNLAGSSVGDLAISPDETFVLSTLPHTEQDNWVKLSATSGIQTINTKSGADVVITTEDLPDFSNILDTLLADKVTKNDVGKIDTGLLENIVARYQNDTLFDGSGVEIRLSKVWSVNGQTGDVRITPESIGARSAGNIMPTEIIGLPATLNNKAEKTDPRFSDARTPTAHAATHAKNGSDPLTLSMDQITGLLDDLGKRATLEDLTRFKKTIEASLPDNPDQHVSAAREFAAISLQAASVSTDRAEKADTYLKQIIAKINEFDTLTGNKITQITETVNNLNTVKLSVEGTKTQIEQLNNTANEISARIATDKASVEETKRLVDTVAENVRQSEQAVGAVRTAVDEALASVNAIKNETNAIKQDVLAEKAATVREREAVEALKFEIQGIKTLTEGLKTSAETAVGNANNVLEDVRREKQAIEVIAQNINATKTQNEQTVTSINDLKREIEGVKAQIDEDRRDIGLAKVQTRADRNAVTDNVVIVTSHLQHSRAILNSITEKERSINLIKNDFDLSSGEIMRMVRENRRLIDEMGSDNMPVLQRRSIKEGDRTVSIVTYWWADYYNGATSNWNQVLKFNANLGFVICNPSSGPGSSQNQDWVKQLNRAKGAGATTLGYVRSNWGKESKANLLDWIKKHVDWYKVDGVFIDEVVNGWSDEQKPYIQFYLDLYNEIKKIYGKDFWVVINPGTNTVEEMIPAGDVLMILENSASHFLKPPQGFNIMPDFYFNYSPSKFWGVVHDVTRDNATQVVSELAKWNFGHIGLTDDKFVDSGDPRNPAQNPYDKAPSAWLLEMQDSWASGAFGYSEWNRASLARVNTDLRKLHNEQQANIGSLITEYREQLEINSDLTWKLDEANTKLALATTTYTTDLDPAVNTVDLSDGGKMTLVIRNGMMTVNVNRVKFTTSNDQLLYTFTSNAWNKHYLRPDVEYMGSVLSSRDAKRLVMRPNGELRVLSPDTATLYSGTISFPIRQA